jgi:hypothetical protein
VGETLTIDFNRPLPLFPLPECVLLPQGKVPLHIFEPRYRKMTHDVLDRHGLIAMALFQGEAWKSDYEGRPPLRPFVCVGYILHHQKLDDGRYNLLLHGVSRARIKTEMPSEPYRMALLEPALPSVSDASCLKKCRRRIEGLLGDPLLKDLTLVRAFNSLRHREVPTDVLVDLMSMAVFEGTEERYKLLAETDVNRRAGWLVEHLKQKREGLAQ